MWGNTYIDWWFIWFILVCLADFRLGPMWRISHIFTPVRFGWFILVCLADFRLGPIWRISHIFAPVRFLWFILVCLADFRLGPIWRISHIFYWRHNNGLLDKGLDYKIVLAMLCREPVPVGGPLGRCAFRRYCWLGLRPLPGRDRQPGQSFIDRSQLLIRPRRHYSSRIDR